MLNKISNTQPNLVTPLLRVGMFTLIAVLSLSLQACGGGAAKKEEATKATAGHADEKSGEHGDEENEVRLSPEALKAAGIETVSVVERPASAQLRVTGSVETNQEQTQQTNFEYFHLQLLYYLSY